jgi:hypothetical protein
MQKFIAYFDRALTDTDGTLTLSFAVKGAEKKKAMECVQEMQKLKLQGKERLTVEVKEFKAKRSLSANAYAWVLIHKLAEKLNLDSVEVYRQFIKELRVFKPIEIKNDAVSTFIKAWSMHGLGWIAEEVDSGQDGFTIINAYYGSSTYNTRQMTKFIENIVNECKSEGIETKTPEEIAKITSLWKAEV